MKPEREIAFVTVARCYSLMEYDRMKVFLESHGITVFPDSEATASIVPWYTSAMGGIRVKVAAAQAENAAEMISALRAAQKPEKPPPEEARRGWTALFGALGVGLLAGLYGGLRDNSLMSGLQMALWLGIASFVIISIVLKPTPPA